MILAYAKNGSRVVLVGYRNTRTNELIPLTSALIDAFKAEFKGVQYLTEPFTVVSDYGES